MRDDLHAADLRLNRNWKIDEMKKILYSGIAAMLLFMAGCCTQNPDNKTKPKPDPKPVPVDFSWIKSSKEINLATGNIYFHGTAEGQYIEAGKWVGKITGDIFCKPKPEKFLMHGLYIPNCTIQVNKDCSINVTAPKDILSVSDKKITFEEGVVVVTGDSGTIKAGGMVYWK